MLLIKRVSLPELLLVVVPGTRREGTHIHEMLYNVRPSIIIQGAFSRPRSSWHAYGSRMSPSPSEARLHVNKAVPGTNGS